MRTRIAFFGDPHGRLARMSEAAAGMDVDAVVCLGDVYCKKSRPAKGETAFRDTAPLRAAGIPYRHIHGNHESDCAENWEGFLSLPAEESLHCRAVRIGGVVGGGMGGVFRQKVWWPGDEPKFRTRAEKLAATQRNVRYKGGLNFKDETSIYPGDFDDLIAVSSGRLAFLATHEAPETHENGFPALTSLARACGAGLIVHGHHHRSYDASTLCGVRARGVGLGHIWIAEFDGEGRLVGSQDMGEVR